MPDLFDAFKLRSLTLPNRIGVSPMCQYSSVDGFANDWHLVHLGSRASGGAGLVIAEATAVTPEGRISPGDLGLWKDEHTIELKRITNFIRSQNSVPAIQLAHAGRKASTAVPSLGGTSLTSSQGGWTTVAPSAVAFEGYTVPQALDEKGIQGVISAFVAASQRALSAGFEVIEIHAAHGYLLHEFLSPLSNHRSDAWGGSFSNRTRLTREIARAIRAIWPADKPIFVRISATDWVEGGWNIEESIELAKGLKEDGVDLIDVSSGGLVADAVIPVGPGYQVKFAERIKKEAGIASAAVGLITEPEQAQAIIKNEQADLVLLAREFLRDPYFPAHAAKKLGIQISRPRQYGRA